jgi:hypothetical protein
MSRFGVSTLFCAGAIALALAGSASASTLTYEITLTQTNGTEITGSNFSVASTPFTVTAPTTSFAQVLTPNFSFTIKGVTYTSDATIQFSGLGPALNTLSGFSDKVGEDTLAINSLTSFQLFSSNSPIDDIPSTIGGTVSVEQVTAAPLPASLPLFVTGLCALGLLGWSRKRKSSAVVAA